MIVFWLSITIILAFVCVIFYQTLKKNAFQKEDEETGEISDMTNAEVSAMVDNWVKSKS